MSETGRCPAILTADAVVAAMRTLGINRIGVIGPRTEMVTEREVQFLREAEFEVVASRCLGLGTTEEERRGIGRVPPEVIYRLALSVDRPEIEAIFVSCTQLPTLPLIEPLERALQKPVITSNQALMWRCLQALHYREPLQGFGRLLTENPINKGIANIP